MDQLVWSGMELETPEREIIAQVRTDSTAAPLPRCPFTYEYHSPGFPQVS